MNIQGQLLFVLFPDNSEGWRVQAVGANPESFESRCPLREEWRGIKDLARLREISGNLSIDRKGLEDIVFVHATGFIGGAKSYESALKMAVMSLG